MAPLPKNCTGFETVCVGFSTLVLQPPTMTRSGGRWLLPLALLAVILATAESARGVAYGE
ncbi:hypothetical protein FOCC_FOCC015940 [Frankliniella occidentalis]|nr:hypothetical protein FOCC_FOCC015940 [Frankliniella occidentalis]